MDLCRYELRERFEGDEQARRRWEREAGQLDDDFGGSSWHAAWRLTQFMRRHGIPYGPGRGRTPASLLAYLLGISRINPLEFGLSCVRDPDPSWSFMAFDVCHRCIDEVTGFVRDSWPGRVARGLAFGRTMAQHQWFLVLTSADSDVRLAWSREEKGGM